MTWSIEGQELVGRLGDWLVISDEGGMRTIADRQFRRTHEHVSGDVWRRTGEVVAFRVDVPTRIATLEGMVTAHRGDWVLQADDGTEWPVADQVFRRSYVALEDGPRS